MSLVFLYRYQAECTLIVGIQPGAGRTFFIKLTTCRDYRVCTSDVHSLSLLHVLSCFILAAAFKAGKIQNNPFSATSTSGGVAIPPPASLQPGTVPVFTVYVNHCIICT
jgi:hypothetical protein